MTENANPAQPKLTPMFEQYLGIKKDYPDSLLFYRMGDFFELFFDDAVTAARELQLTLTSRNPGAENPIPMCGVPHHSVNAYIQPLLNKGYQVVLCDQVENPKEAKGLVKRAVKKVLTSGTAVEEYNLDFKEHNYLGAVYWDAEKNGGAFAFADNSTGQWSGLQSSKESEIWQWVQKMAPRELLVPDLPSSAFKVPPSIALEGIQTVRVPVKSFFELKSASRRLLQAQNVREEAALGLDGKPELIMCCGALLAYLAHTQQQDPQHLLPFSPMNLGRYLVVDEVSEKNLEIFRRMDGKKGPGTLRHVLDETVTPMGGRLLEERLRNPWRDLPAIESTQEAVGWFVKEGKTRKRLREALESVYDLERLSTRISLDSASPKDFAALRQSLNALPRLRASLDVPELGEQGAYPTSDDELGLDMPGALRSVLEHWDNLEEYAALLDRALVDNPPLAVTEGGLFRPGYNAELDELLDLAEHGAQRLKDLLRREQENCCLPKLKMGYNRVFGYYFELTRSGGANVPEHFIRRQTLANAERFTTTELKELDEKIMNAAERRNSLEHNLFQALRQELAKARSRLMFMASGIAALDFWQALAECAAKNGWNKPRLHNGLEINIREGRHPVVEAVQGRGGFIPNNLFMDEKRRLIIITGPNMAGKSTVLRQTAIICLLAQMGSFVPASEALIGLADRIFCRVGASDNLAQGQSTFMVEMMETARILRQATRRSLVILDEIGRGTSTFDGLSLAWAVVEDLVRRADSSVRTLFATHYHELTALEGRLEGVHNMNIAVKEWKGEIIFLRRLVPGPTDRSYGIEVARLAGVPGPVVQRAKEILKLLEQSKKRDMPADQYRSATDKANRMQALPGLDLPEPEESAARLLPEQALQVKHPLLVALQDVDVDRLAPLRALELINEWKILWGEKDA